MDLQTKIAQAKEIIQKNGDCPTAGCINCKFCAFNENKMCPANDLLLLKIKAFLFDNGLSNKDLEE